MRYLVRLVSSGASQSAFLGSVKGVANGLGVEARNPKWTSHGALELDIFTPTRADFDLFLLAIDPLCELDFTRDLNVPPRHRPEEEVLEEARRYFNSERYWECHEVLEEIWRVKVGEDKRFLQGMILICAAFVHHQKGEEGVALGVLKRAIAQLELSTPTYHGIHVAALKTRAMEVLSEKKFRVFEL